MALGDQDLFEELIVELTIVVDFKNVVRFALRNLHQLTSDDFSKKKSGIDDYKYQITDKR